MQSDQFSPNKAGFDPGNRTVDSRHAAPFHGFEFHPSEVCPKNFIIFDQTVNRSQIMFHPGIAHKFNPPSFNFQANNERNEESLYQEDSDDIDALLSSEDEDEDDEELSTARTYGSLSPESFSSSSSTQKLSSCYDYERKRSKMRKMVKALRGIVPGGDEMNSSVTVIDEAVRYLKSLKVEVQKLGAENLRTD